MSDAGIPHIAVGPEPSSTPSFSRRPDSGNHQANEHAEENPRRLPQKGTTHRIPRACGDSRSRQRDGLHSRPSQHIVTTRANRIPYSDKSRDRQRYVGECGLPSRCGGERHRSIGGRAAFLFRRGAHGCTYAGNGWVHRHSKDSGTSERNIENSDYRTYRRRDGGRSGEISIGRDERLCVEAV